jgi:hypothetical protein
MMMGFTTPEESAEGRPLRLRLADAKQLAKRIKVTAVILHGQALDSVCRSAGYLHYNDALHNPRDVSITLDDWRLRLCEEVDLPPTELLSDEDFEHWFTRLFAVRGRNALAGVGRGSSTMRDPDCMSADLQVPSTTYKDWLEHEDHLIPSHVCHAETIADTLSRRPSHGQKRG